jgi:TonB family protein
LLKAATVDTKPDGAYVAKTQRADDQALFQTFAPESAEVSEKPKTAKKKWMIIAPVSGASVLLLLALTGMLLHRGSKPEAKPPVQPPAQTSETQTVPDDSNSPNSAPAAQTPPSPATETQPAASTPASSGQDGVKPAPGLTKKQTKLMNDQLAAPTVIPQNKQSAENAPPPVNIAANGADGLGGMGANDGVLNGHTQAAPKVVSARPFAISSGVAAGMLIRQTPPVYPAIAKAAGVSGTVVLHATITRNGTIKDVQVVSGSPMLQQAALDAVRTWRYKPYKLSNEPIEVDTAISVVFSAAK